MHLDILNLLHTLSRFTTDKTTAFAVSIADINQAAERLAPVAVRTPMLECPYLNNLAGRRVLIKAEVLQRTGSCLLRAGSRLANNGNPETFCDSIVTPMPGELTFPILYHLAGSGLCIDDDAVLTAMGLALMRLKLVVEPGGAVNLAEHLLKGLLERALSELRYYWV